MRSPEPLLLDAHAAQAPTPAEGDARQAQIARRRADWLFLLPAPPDGVFRHLVVLGGPPRIVRQAEDLRIAHRVSGEPTGARTADVVIRLHDAGVDIEAAAESLLPGGVMYFETDRAAEAGAPAPARTRARLRAAGLRPVALYWIRPHFGEHRFYLPADRPAAIRWFYSSVHAGDSLRERATTLSYRTLASLGSGVLERAMRCYATVARAGREGPGTPALVSASAAAGCARLVGESHPVMLAPRLRRVVLLPFGPDSARPTVVIKALRLGQDAPTRREQEALTALRERLDESMRRTVPVPLARGTWLGRGVGVESFAEGRLLRRRPSGLPRSARARWKELRLVCEWLTTFHRQTRQETLSIAAALEERLDRSCSEYARHFGLTADEDALFDRGRRAARRHRTIPVPLVWRHGDLSSRNIYRSGGGIEVIDWENAAPGLPLMDLLFFLAEWLRQDARETDARHQLFGIGRSPAARHRFAAVFGEGTLRDPATAQVQASVRRYMQALELSPPLYPVILLLLWTELAVAKAHQPRSVDAVTDAVRSTCIANVRALSRWREALLPAAGYPTWLA